MHTGGAIQTLNSLSLLIDATTQNTYNETAKQEIIFPVFRNYSYRR